jgi:Amt family ammonium transporter
MTRTFAVITFCILLVLIILSLTKGVLPGPIQTENINAADTAWMLTSTALVLIMTPGLAFFYGGMVNKKNVLSTMLQSFICMAVISIVWVVVGFSLAFGETYKGIIGNPSTFFMMNNVIDGDPWELAPTSPLILFAFYQLKFAQWIPK